MDKQSKGNGAAQPEAAASNLVNAAGAIVASKSAPVEPFGSVELSTPNSDAIFPNKRDAGRSTTAILWKCPLTLANGLQFTVSGRIYYRSVVDKDETTYDSDTSLPSGFVGIDKETSNQLRAHVNAAVEKWNGYNVAMEAAHKRLTEPNKSKAEAVSKKTKLGWKPDNASAAQRTSAA